MVDRRSTTRQTDSHSSLRFSNPNVFSDDYALEEYHPVADGRTPASTPHEPLPQRSSSMRQGLESPRGSIRRSRLSQRSIGQDSMTSRPDTELSRQSRADLAHSVSARHRSVRTISTLGPPRAQSPYQGPTGPSQPYGMYSQDVSLGRSPSVATTSTIRPLERAYSGPAGPTQPYAMYSQNTVPEDGQEVAGMAPSMPGLAVTAAQPQAVRRLGPDGEDADDIIGPDGYAEQLPPYSRYANGIPPKFDSGAANFINHPTPLQSQAGPVTATPHSEPTENRPELSEYYRPDNREVVPASPATVNPFDDTSAISASTTTTNSLQKTEKSTFKEKVKRRGNKRVCCGLLSCWALLFMIVVLCAAMLLGGVIGGIVAHHTSQKHYSSPHSQPQPQDTPVTTTTTTMADASALTATPTDLPALPTGAFNYVLDTPVADQMSNSCLPTTQSIAWGCATGANMNISINMQSLQKPQLTIGFTTPPNPQAPNSLSTQIRYGPQPPTLPGPVNLNLARDNLEWNLGPAYIFQQPYAKTVILKAGDLPGSYPKSKRFADDSSFLEERGQIGWNQGEFVSIADKPWYCFWNGTYLEAFIYVTQNENFSSASTTVTGSSSASPTTMVSMPYHKRQASQSTSGATYPKVIKIIERRPLRNIPQPYCQQMQIMNNGQPSPYQPNGQPVIFNLNEHEPIPLQQQQFRQTGDPAPPSTAPQKEKRQVGQRAWCMCEWQS